MTDVGWGSREHALPWSGARRAAPTEQTRAPAPTLPACPARHCWVTDDGGVRRPALLVEWRSTPAGWEGRVVSLMRVRGSRWALVEEWVPAGLLRREGP